MKIFIYHPDWRENAYTQLAADYSASVTTAKVKNTNGFATNKYAVLGSIGFEQSEIVQTSTVTAPDTLGFAATKFPHNSDSRVTQFDYNQIKIYKSTTGISGTYNLLTTIDIQIDSEATPYEDTTSNTTDYYKFSYYNSVASLESSLSDAISATGFVWYSLKTLTDRVLSLFGDLKTQMVSRSEVMDYLNEFYEEAQRKYAIATKRIGVKFDTITLQAGVDEYNLFGDFLVEKAVKFSQDNGVTYPYSGVNKNIDSVGSTDATNTKYDYVIYGSKIKFDPMPQTNGEICKIYYVPSPVLLQLQTDTLAAPFQNSTAMFVAYAYGMCKLKDSKDDWTTHVKRAQDKLDDFISYIKQMQNRHVSFTEILDRRA